MHFHPEMFVGRDEFRMLRLTDLHVAGRLAQIFARQGRGGQVPQMRRRAQQNVSQRVGLIAKTLIFQRLGAALPDAALQAERFGTMVVRLHSRHLLCLARSVSIGRVVAPF